MSCKPLWDRTILSKIAQLLKVDQTVQIQWLSNKPKETVLKKPSSADSGEMGGKVKKPSKSRAVLENRSNQT